MLGGVGLVILAAGLFALAMLGRDASDLDVAWRMVVCGLGFGFFQAPNNRTMIAAAPRSRAGAAGGMLATARLTGQTAGATMVAIFLAAWPDRGEHIALIVGACLALGGAVASTMRLRTTRERA
jgi:DHA2 family multidrug resistance protein-like MFS transporter